MQVKPRLQLSVIAAVCSLLWGLAAMGCAPSGQLSMPGAESLELARGRLGPFVSLALAGDRLCAVFSDLDTASLALCEIPLGARLPTQAPSRTLIDKVDATPPYTTEFGAHVLAVTGSALHVLYLDREGPEKSVLKVASREMGSSTWSLDVLEPAGQPVGALPRGDGSLSILWSTDALLMRPFPSSAEPSVVRSPFAASAPGLPFESGSLRGIAALDQMTGIMSVVTLSDSGPTVRDLPDPGTGASACATADGRIAIACYRADTRRIELLEQTGDGGQLTRSAVILSEETTRTFIASRAGGYLFVYDETDGLGKSALPYRISVLAMEGGRYVRRALSLGHEPVAGLATVVWGEVLYTLVLRDELVLYRAPLPR